MTEPVHGHKAKSSTTDPYKVRSMCTVCGRGIVKMKASSTLPERWAHEKSS